jgi:hypothetical protein
MRRFAELFLLLFGGAAVLLLSGCAVENEMLAKMPLFEAKSDKIPGLDPPQHRKKLIREKGEKGAKASAGEQEILAAQLMYEYETSPDPNMRREAVEALAKIPHPSRFSNLESMLKDADPFIRISALEAMSRSEGGQTLSICIDRMKNDSDKDVRLTAVRLLGTLPELRKNVLVFDKGMDDQPRRNAVEELGNLLQDKTPAIRYASMTALQKITGMDYGRDINKWTQYMKYHKGEIPDVPKERTFSEKLPAVSLPMFK